ncbi:DUF2334 domain-containing protein [Sarcina ventriculi]|uniref:Uncharacterized protein conserved in bacteria n=1 Tax=Sarcina ventriculi TaxID=1267 RepID=A0ABM9UJ85_SARVE|nr:DUF2334 domain-containing protein [Sarcina ventriculi]CUN41499.1 Uncharacterized protein conserved in bacteria [Sarcina ventriculi]
MKQSMLLKFLGIIFVLLYFPKGEMVVATDYTDVLIVENSAENYIVTEAIKNVLGVYGAKERCIKDVEYNYGELFNYDKVIIISNANISNSELIFDLENFTGDIFWVGSGVSQILKDNVNKEHGTVWKINNIWNMVIIPNEFESFLTLTEAFNSFFEKENDEYLRMFLKITNVNTLSDSTKLREIADYLHSEGVPFIIVLDEILDIKNLNINENDIIYYNVKEFFSTIRYMIDKGGSVVIKNNFIHKNYLANENDEKSILEKFIIECAKNNIYPLGIEITSEKDFEKLKNSFNTFMYSGELNNVFKYPFIITDFQNSYNIITNNVGKIDSNNKNWLQNIEYNIKKLLKVKGSVGTVSYNSILDIEYLKQIVKSLNKENIKYFNLSYMKNKIELNKIEISSSNGDINCIIKSYDDENILNTQNENIDLKKNFFHTRLNFILLGSIVILSILFILIYNYCKNNNNKIA